MNIVVPRCSTSVDVASGTPAAALVGRKQDGEQEIGDARGQCWELLSDLASALTPVVAHVILPLVRLAVARFPPCRLVS